MNSPATVCARYLITSHFNIPPSHNGDGSLIRTGSTNSRQASPRSPDVVVRSPACRHPSRQLCEGQGRARASREGAIDAPSAVAPRIPSPDAVVMVTISPDPHCLEETARRRTERDPGIGYQSCTVARRE